MSVPWTYKIKTSTQKPLKKKSKKSPVTILQRKISFKNCRRGKNHIICTCTFHLSWKYTFVQKWYIEMIYIPLCRQLRCKLTSSSFPKSCQCETAGERIWSPSLPRRRMSWQRRSPSTPAHSPCCSRTQWGRCTGQQWWLSTVSLLLC